MVALRTIYPVLFTIALFFAYFDALCFVVLNLI